MPVRYQCYQHGGEWHWRLLGANNRPLARSGEPLPDLLAAMADASAMVGAADGGRVEVVGNGRGWRWELVLGGRVRAASAVGYARRLDCVRAMARFRADAPIATVSPEVLLDPAARQSVG